MSFTLCRKATTSHSSLIPLFKLDALFVEKKLELLHILQQIDVWDDVLFELEWLHAVAAKFAKHTSFKVDPRATKKLPVQDYMMDLQPGWPEDWL